MLVLDAMASHYGCLPSVVLARPASEVALNLLIYQRAFHDRHAALLKGVKARPKSMADIHLSILNTLMRLHDAT